MIVMAEEARRRGDTDEALRIYKQYLALHRDPYAMNNLGALLILKGQFKEAEQVLQEAFQLAPTDGDIAANLIGVEMMIGKSSQACEILSRFKKGSTPIPPAIKALEPYLGNCQ
jgi:Flp pilus assembly protein TadD